MDDFELLVEVRLTGWPPVYVSQHLAGVVERLALKDGNTVIWDEEWSNGVCVSLICTIRKTR